MIIENIWIIVGFLIAGSFCYEFFKKAYAEISELDKSSPFQTPVSPESAIEFEWILRFLGDSYATKQEYGLARLWPVYKKVKNPKLSLKSKIEPQESSDAGMDHEFWEQVLYKDCLEICFAKYTKKDKPEISKKYFLNACKEHGVSTYSSEKYYKLFMENAGVYVSRLAKALMSIADNGGSYRENSELFFRNPDFANIISTKAQLDALLSIVSGEKSNADIYRMLCHEAIRIKLGDGVHEAAKSYLVEELMFYMDKDLASVAA